MNVVVFEFLMTEGFFSQTVSDIFQKARLQSYTPTQTPHPTVDFPTSPQKLP